MQVDKRVQQGERAILHTRAHTSLKHHFLTLSLVQPSVGHPHSSQIRLPTTCVALARP